MSASPIPRISDTLLPTNDFSASAEEPPPPTLRVVGETAPPPLLTPPDLPAAADDPLRAINLLSEEEKIALCS